MLELACKPECWPGRFPAACPLAVYLIFLSSFPQSKMGIVVVSCHRVAVKVERSAKPQDGLRLPEAVRPVALGLTRSRSAGRLVSVHCVSMGDTRRFHVAPDLSEMLHTVPLLLTVPCT